MRVLIYDTLHLSIIPMLQHLGFDADYVPDISRQQMMNVLHQYEGIIGRSKTVLDQALLSKAPNLRFIGRSGAGLDDIDLNYAKHNGIEVLNSPEGNRDAVAEHAMGMLLSLLNNLNKADTEVRNKIWDREANRGTSLMGLTVGIIGFGNMGQAIGKRLGAFGVNLLVYDKYLTTWPDNIAYKPVSLTQLQAESDVISLNVPLTEETNFMIDNNFIRKMAKPFWLINTARGKVVSNDALLEGLTTYKVKGAALDVLENEHLSKLTVKQSETFDQLITYQNVLFSPHVAGWSDRSYYKLNEALCRKVAALHHNSLK